jgi:hypothetical protein
VFSAIVLKLMVYEGAPCSAFNFCRLCRRDCIAEFLTCLLGKILHCGKGRLRMFACVPQDAAGLKEEREEGQSANPKDNLRRAPAEDAYEPENHSQAVFWVAATC